MPPDPDRPLSELNEEAVRRPLWLARLVLLWERLWPALWPPLGVVGLFVAVALFDVLPLLPGWMHAAVLGGFAVAAVLLLVRGLLGLRLPTVRDARHRLERDNALAHHPLDALADRLPPDARLDPGARALWRAHQQRMAAAVRRLRVGIPEPGLPARDPWGLRAAVLLLLVIAGAGTWNADPWGRIARAVTPALGLGGGDPAAVQVWLNPPDYTGEPPIFLEAPSETPPAEPLAVPEGTRVLAALQGGRGEPILHHAKAEVPFASLGEGSWRAETTLTEGGSLAVKQGLGTVAKWDVEVVPDQAPRIALLAAQQDDRARLVLEYEVADDYDLRRAQVRLQRPEPPGSLPVADEQKLISLPLPTGDSTTRASWHDLTAHPWAGLPVTLQPEAEDGAGQVGRGEAMEVVLPKRRFTHPVAREIVALRRELARDPSRRPAVIEGLDVVSSRPDRFGHDHVVFLALRVARARLAHDPTVEALIAAREVMWDTALRLEEGEAAVAERALMQAQQDLREALEQGASPEEIEELMDLLQAALENYMQALAREMARQGMEPMPMPEGMQTITPQEMSEMIERMRDLAQMGATEAAREMLAQLEQMLRGMRPNMQAMQGEAAEQMRQAQQALSDLQDIARQQRQLLDQSHRQQGQQPPDAQALAENAEQQEALRRRLGEAMRQLGESLGEIPPSLGEAEQAMRGATRSLQEGDPMGAGQAQAEALEHLQQGARQAMRSMQRQMAGQGMMPMPQGSMGQGRDPLGRRLDGWGGFDDRSVDVPEEGEIHRAHEILEELRRRAADPQRPEPERDYLRRLLERF